MRVDIMIMDDEPLALDNLIMQREHNEDKISKACQLIGGSNDIHYDMKEAAAAVNMGYESFRKLFKATTGLSPQRYHIEQLMNALFFWHS